MHEVILLFRETRCVGSWCDYCRWFSGDLFELVKSILSSAAVVFITDIKADREELRIKTVRSQGRCRSSRALGLVLNVRRTRRHDSLKYGNQVQNRR